MGQATITWGFHHRQAGTVICVEKAAAQDGVGIAARTHRTEDTLTIFSDGLTARMPRPLPLPATRNHALLLVARPQHAQLHKENWFRRVLTHHACKTLYGLALFARRGTCAALRTPCSGILPCQSAYRVSA